MKSNGIRKEDCLALLCYVSKHRDDEQSFSILEDELNIPRATLFLMLMDAREQKEESLLYGVALHNGFGYHIYERVPRKRGKIIDVEYLGLLR